MTTTNNPEVKIAILQTQMNNIEKKVDEGFRDVKSDLDKLHNEIMMGNSLYMPRTEMIKQIDDLIKADAEIKHIATTRSWLMGAAGALIGVIMTIITALLINYFRTR